jgi:hypothetical protein
MCRGRMAGASFTKAASGGRSRCDFRRVSEIGGKNACALLFALKTEDWAR